MRLGNMVVFVIVAILGGCTALKAVAPSWNSVPTKTTPDERLTGQQLNKLFSGATVYGRIIESEKTFVERYESNGDYLIAISQGSRTGIPLERYKGTWQIKQDQVCYRTPSTNVCTEIHKKNVQYLFVDTGSSKPRAYAYEIKYEDDEKPRARSTLPPNQAATTQRAIASGTEQEPSRKLKPIASGSGFFVNNQAYVLTNEHVIEKCIEVTVRVGDRDIKADVGAQDKQNDLALLRLPTGKYSTVVFQAGNTLYPGDSVVAIGYPLNRILASEGNVSVGTVSALAGFGNDASMLQISNPIQLGNSGGPLLDLSGNVVGVVVSKLNAKRVAEITGDIPQNVNFAIKSVIVMAFMHASGVEYEARDSVKELRPAEVARKGRPATVPIQCWE